MKTKAAILAKSREPLVIDEIELPDTLEAGHVLVHVLYTSICGAQINEIDAVKGPDKWLPHLLGHEASGIVMDVGPGVQHVNVGDHVVLHWRPSQGIQAEPARYRWRGESLNAGWVTTFQEHTIVSENRLTPIPRDFDPKIAPLFGCALTTALGVVNNDARIKIGESVVVFGLGGVGLHIAQFAKMAGAWPVIGIDPNLMRREFATTKGADMCLNFESQTQIAERIRLTLIEGADKVIDTTGIKSIIELAYEITHPKGTCVLVGVPSEKVSLYTLPIHLGKTLTGSEGGQSRPHIDIPKLVQMKKFGLLDLDGVISREFPLNQINDAIEAMRAGGGRMLISADP